MEEEEEEILEQMEMIDEEEEESENSKIMTPKKRGHLINQKPYFSPEIHKTLPPLNPPINAPPS